MGKLTRRVIFKAVVLGLLKNDVERLLGHVERLEENLDAHAADLPASDAELRDLLFRVKTVREEVWCVLQRVTAFGRRIEGMQGQGPPTRISHSGAR